MSTETRVAGTDSEPWLVQWEVDVNTALMGLFVLDEMYAWACGADSTILSFGSNGWSNEVIYGDFSYFNDVWAADYSNVWVVGDGGAIGYFDGTDWRYQDCGTDGNLTDISGSSSSNVMVLVDYSGNGIHYDGQTWEPMETGADFLCDIDVYSDSCAWAVGTGSDIVRFNGAGWSDVPLAPEMQGKQFSEVDILDPTHVWVAGNDALYFYNGSSWSVCPGAPIGDWSCLIARSTNCIWGLVDYKIHHYDGESWNFIDVEAPETFLDMSMSSDENVLLVGNRGDFVYQLRGVCDEAPPIDPDPGQTGPPEPRPSTRWYFAEGSTNGGFETWITVQNPQAEQAGVEITYMTPGGAVQGPILQVGPRSRTTVFIADTVPSQWEVSTFIESDRDIIAERSMYWGNRIAGHDSVGTNQAAEAWGLAEGCTRGGFETWVTVQNPETIATTAEFVFLTPDGPFMGPTIPVSAMGRKSINIGDYMPDEWDISTMVGSDTPIVVERSVYWNSRTGGHNSMGLSFEATDWMLAEGSTNGGFETWITILNPGAEENGVQLFFFTEDGPEEGPLYVMPPYSRTSLNVGDYVPDRWGVSTRVLSDSYVLAERSVYWNGRKGGHNSIGKFLGAREWYVPEGCTRGGFETWVQVLNPNSFAAEVEVSYMTKKGPCKGPTVEVPPYTRKSLHVADCVPDEWEVSTHLVSDRPVVVEKSIYWSGRIEGGCSNGVSIPDE